MTISIIERNGLSLASGIGFLTLMAAFCYGNAIGVPVRAMMENAKYVHSMLERKSNITTFDADDPNIDPMLARDFVLFVMKDAFDANPSRAAQSHKTSQGWMTAEAHSQIKSMFWEYPELSKICFVSQSAEPTTNKRSPVITVKVQGYFHDHLKSPGKHHPFSMTFDVIKEKTGLRLNEIRVDHEGIETLTELANE
ncbi:MAG: hypothetical protein SFY67_14640 [Candidatus Melainabacteria bacterium]|nr:hypothetical protein [Candidatus Melainabacteria bacterium]